MKKLLTILLLSVTILITKAEKLPNVILIYTDDLGYGDVSYQNPISKIHTPCIDSLAKAGMAFTDGHSSSGLCTPSRFSILTGIHHWRRSIYKVTGAFDEALLKKDDFTLPKMFKSMGYSTIMVGKWHLGMNWDNIKTDKGREIVKPKKGSILYKTDSFHWDKPIKGGPISAGFDYFFGNETIFYPPYTYIENEHITNPPTEMLNASKFRKDIKEGFCVRELRMGPAIENWSPFDVLPLFNKKAVQLIKDYNQNKPFFLYYAMPSPHAPIVPNKEYIGKSQAGYYGDFVVETDDMIGRVIQALKDKGIYENTVIIFSSDNGPEGFEGRDENYAFDRIKEFQHWSSGQFRGVKRDLWEGGHRVPFIITWGDKIKAGSVSNETVNQVDLYATLANIIGYKLNEKEAIDSHNLLPVLLAEDYQKPIREATVFNTVAKKFAIKQGDWVLIDGKFGGTVNPAPSTETPIKSNSEKLLFNLNSDPAQTTNLYDQNIERAKQMSDLLKRYKSGEPCAKR